MYTHIGDLPQVYSNLLYGMYTVTVQAVSDSVNVTIVQKGNFIYMSTVLLLFTYSVNGHGRNRCF